MYLYQSIALFAVLAIAVAYPQGPVLTRSEIRDDYGQFALSYNTANGLSVAQRGALKSLGTGTALVQEGAYSYVGTDGKLYTLKYIADENGFQPIADFLPTAPPLPEVPVVPVA